MAIKYESIPTDDPSITIHKWVGITKDEPGVALERASYARVAAQVDGLAGGSCILEAAIGDTFTAACHFLSDGINDLPYCRAIKPVVAGQDTPVTVTVIIRRS